MSDAEMAAARSHVVSTLRQALSEGQVVYDDGLQPVTGRAERGTRHVAYLLPRGIMSNQTKFVDQFVVI